MFAILALSLLFSASNPIFKPTPNDWLVSQTIDSLLMLYREKSTMQLSDERIIEFARSDYSEIVKSDFIRKPIPLKDRLAPVIVNVDDVEYRLYGFTHDLNEKNCPADYKAFVEKAVEFEISEGSTLVAEQRLSAQFGAHADLFVETPDHMFSPEVKYKLAVGGVVLGLTGFRYQEKPTGLTRIEEYSIDIDSREGLKQRLPGEIESQIFLKNLVAEGAVWVGTCGNERSVFMAGFLKSLAMVRNKQKIAFFMGYDHLPLVRSCLENREGLCSERSEYLKGLIFGMASDHKLKEFVERNSNLTSLFN